MLNVIVSSKTVERIFLAQENFESQILMIERIHKALNIPMLEAFFPRSVKAIFDDAMSKKPFIYAFIAFILMTLV